VIKDRRFRYILGILIGVSLLFAGSRFIDLAQAREEFGEFPWPRLTLVLTLSLVYYLLKAIRWQYLLQVMGVQINWRRSLLIYFSGQWFAFTPAGELVRAYLLTGYGFSFSYGSAAVAVQVIFDFLSLAIIGSLAMFAPQPGADAAKYQQLAPVVLPFTLGLAIFVLVFAYWPMLRQRIGGQPPIGKVNHEGHWHGFFQHSRLLLAPGPLLVGLALGLVTVLVGAATLYVVCSGYNIEQSFGQASYVYSLSQLVGGLSMLPHGLGAIEGSSVALFGYAGVDTAHAASAIVLFRLATVGWSILLGGLSLLALRTPLAGPVPKLPDPETVRTLS
jgi:glycosyltransferase 2 family protein